MKRSSNIGAWLAALLVVAVISTGCTTGRDSLTRHPGDPLRSHDPLEVCGNNADEDRDGIRDSADSDCELFRAPDLPPLKSGDCRVIVVWDRVNIRQDNDAGEEDEYSFTASAGGPVMRFPAAGEHIVPEDASFPFAVAIKRVLLNAVIANAKLGAVTIPFTAVAVENDGGLRFGPDVAASGAKLTLPCPGSALFTLRAVSVDDVDVEFDFRVWLDP